MYKSDENKKNENHGCSNAKMIVSGQLEWRFYTFWTGGEHFLSFASLSVFKVA